MTGPQETRGRILEIVSALQQVDTWLGELSAGLPLPLDAEEMWNSRVPLSFTVNLYAAVEAVRGDCIQDAVETLMHAARQTDDSLRRDWLLAATGGADPGPGPAGSILRWRRPDPEK